MKNLYNRYLEAVEPFGFIVSFEEFEQIVNRYKEPHRFFHNFNHVLALWDLIDVKYPDAPIYRAYYYVAALFHDVVYDPRNSDNEEQSVEFFKKMFHSENWTKETELPLLRICGLIMGTKWDGETVYGKESKTVDDFVWDFVQLDIDGLYTDWDIVNSERNIFKEYQVYSLDKFREGRLKVLENFTDPVYDVRENIARCRFHVANFRPKIGIFVGTFNKFHSGHLDVLNSAEKIFDKVIICCAINPDKKVNKDETVAQVKKALPFHEVIAWEGLLVDLVKKIEAMGADVSVVKGFRNGQDIPYEMQLLRFMQDQCPEISVVYIPCDSKYEHISSSMLRGLSALGVTDSDYLPKKYNYVEQGK